MSAIRIRKNLLGSTEPQCRQKELQDILKDSYFGTICLRPVYQRHIRWNKDAMNDFIGTVMNNGLVPGVIMYRLHSEDKDEKTRDKEYEVVDGQHRLFSLKAFIDSTQQILPHIAKPFIVYWNYEVMAEDGTKISTPVFYKDTEDVREWCKFNQIVPSFLTQEEKNYFDSFTINITTIRDYVTLEQRREMFMSLQKGVPVRNSDFLKNKTDCKFVAFIAENGYEQMMMDVFLDHCHKKANNYWVHWVTRCYLIYIRFRNILEPTKNKPISEYFLIEDKTIKKLIESNVRQLNPDNIDIIHEFDDQFRTFINFLQKMGDGVKLNPTQIFALFCVICNENVNMDTILSHMPYFAKEGNTKEKKTMWESRDEMEPRRRYFNDCLMFLESIQQPACHFDTKQISQSLRKKVWLKCIGGKCDICYEEINENNFEAGHIRARALGGQIDIDNLIPICFSCNRSMGTRNPYEYKKDVYPHLCV